MWKSFHYVHIVSINVHLWAFVLHNKNVFTLFWFNWPESANKTDVDQIAHKTTTTAGLGAVDELRPATLGFFMVFEKFVWVHTQVNRAGVHLFDVHQISSELSHLPKRSKLCEETNCVKKNPPAWMHHNEKNVISKQGGKS